MADGLEITNLENGEAMLSGEILDQSALHGTLNKVRDLGLPLLALRSADLDHLDHQEPAIRPAPRWPD